jgi:hypothetical protein
LLIVLLISLTNCSSFKQHNLDVEVCVIEKKKVYCPVSKVSVSHQTSGQDFLAISIEDMIEITEALGNEP